MDDPDASVGAVVSVVAWCLLVVLSAVPAVASVPVFGLPVVAFVGDSGVPAAGADFLSDVALFPFAVDVSVLAFGFAAPVVAPVSEASAAVSGQAAKYGHFESVGLTAAGLPGGAEPATTVEEAG